MSNLSNYRPAALIKGRYPSWVSKLKGRSGVYVIRSKSSGKILYVGESHTGRLKKTMTRHFQVWRGSTAGNVYFSGHVEVAVSFERKDRAQARQWDLIRRLVPRDNSG